MAVCCGIGRPVCGQPVSNMTITAVSGAQQTLIGLGATMPSAMENYSAMPRATRLAMARMIWSEEGLGFRVCRLWDDDAPISNGARMLSAYKMLYDDLNSVQPHMIWLCGCTGHPAREGLEAYAAHHAQVVADCKAGGLVFQYVGTCNEPDDNLYPPTQAAELVKDFRRELDKRGLHDVKLVAADCANVDRRGMSYIQNIKDEPAALASLAVFATHSANMCMSPAYYDLVHVPGKESWSTEGDANGPEGTGPDGVNAEPLAAYFAAHVCNDLNFGANVWLHFIGYDAYDPRDNATRIMGYDPSTFAYQPFLVYHYYKQMRRGFKDGCVLRRSTSNDTRERVYRQMCFTYGDKPAIIGAAGRNADGSWGLNVVNLTGEPNSLSGNRPGNANYQPAAAYSITYHVAELANAGVVGFNLYRSNTKVQDACQGTVLMMKGDVTFTVAPLELVTLVSAPIPKRFPTP